ncbi:MAG: hypothetical protein HC882_01380 [Acidobacteria bacterium]|nr:hypothetical protein [Acidobacteriota bacterium]
MKTKPFPRWTEAERTKARDLVAFVKRHTKQMGSACRPKRIIALRNWAHQPSRCGVPKEC